MKKNLLFVVYQSTGDYNTTILSKKGRFDYEKAIETAKRFLADKNIKYKVEIEQVLYLVN